MKFHSNKFLFTILSIFIQNIRSWDLRSLNLTSFSIIHVSIYCNRAFLSIESTNNRKIPTLIEASWPENMLSIRPKVFSEDPTIRYLRPGLICDHIVNARATDIDRKGNLWILDDGGKYHGRECLPKLSIHCLLLLNERIHVHEFPEFRSLRFASLVFDPVVADELDTRAFFTFDDSSFIVLYSLREKKYAKVKFESNEIFRSGRPILSEVIINYNDLMYLLDANTGNLYSTSTTSLRYTPIRLMERQAGHQYSHSSVSIRVRLNYVGSLLGRAKSIVLHPRGRVFYILPRDGAVMEWHPRLPLSAEYHEVAYLGGGNLTQIVFGWKGSVWAVSSHYLYDQGKKYSHTIRIRYA